MSVCPSVSYLVRTLVSLIVVQDGINVQDGIFHFLLMQNKVLDQNYPKLINVQDGIRACRLEFAARLFDRFKYFTNF